MTTLAGYVSESQARIHTGHSTRESFRVWLCRQRKRHIIRTCGHAVYLPDIARVILT